MLVFRRRQREYDPYKLASPQVYLWRMTVFLIIAAFIALILYRQVINAFQANPALTWVAITGYGWTGAAASRVAFGDDAAAAGGLVRWTKSGAPRFLGDALADPVTGLAAAIGALKGLASGGGVLVDVSLAGSAACAAADRKAAA